MKRRRISCKKVNSGHDVDLDNKEFFEVLGFLFWYIVIMFVAFIMIFEV